MGRILLVEDEESLRDVLSRYLEAHGHQCDFAEDGVIGVERVTAAPGLYDVIISDIEMPRMDGITFLRRVQPYIESITPFMILTAYDEWRYAMDAIRLGACNFLQKNPFDLAEIANAVEKALETREMYKLRMNHQEQLEAEVREKTQELQRTCDGTVMALAAMIEGKDTSTLRHLFRVREFCRMLARELGLPDKRLRELELGSMIHDIGKYSIPDAILTKPGSLTAEEWVEMRKHPENGRDFVRNIPFLKGAEEVVYCHHERYDGGGYPQGLAAEDIPITARIFSVVDAFDAIVSERCYKPARPASEAISELHRCSGTQFDPGVVEAFVRIIPAIEARRGDLDAMVQAQLVAMGLGRAEDRPAIRDRIAKSA
ncbi:MAG: response regulator [Planctomycetota bacterium]|nr:response regulator [Planctomycetota bacterium]